MQGEFSSCQHHLGSVVCAALPLLSNNLSSNIIVNHSVRIWVKFRRHFGLQGTSTLTPIKSNHTYVPSCADPEFTLWFNKGIRLHWPTRANIYYIVRTMLYYTYFSFYFIVFLFLSHTYNLCLSFEFMFACTCT